MIAACIAILLILLSTLLHEVGHAYFLLKHGIPIRELGIGVSPSMLIGKPPTKPLAAFSGRTLHFAFITLSVPRIAFHALPIGAYVEPDEAHEERFNALSVPAKIEIYGAGSYVHLVLATVLWGMIFALISAYAALLGVHPPREALLHMLASALVFLALTVFRGFVLRHGPLILSAVGIVTIIILFSSPEGRGSLGGIVGVAALASQSTSILDVLAIVMAVNLSMAIVNAMPLRITDGAQVLNALLGKAKAPQKFQTSIRRTSAVVLIVLVFLSFYNDIINFVL